MKMKYVKDYMFVVNWFSFDFKKCMIFFNFVGFNVYSDMINCNNKMIFYEIFFFFLMKKLG